MGKLIKKLNSFGALIVFSNLILFGARANAEVSPPAKSLLSISEKESLRYHLEGLFNDVDLIIKNRKSRNADLKRQERDLAYLKVYERIPLQRNLPQLKVNLKETAKDHQITLTQIKILGFSKPGKPIPKSQFADQPQFQIEPNQLVEEIRFKMIAQGGVEQIQNWTSSWRTEQMRIVELASSDLGKSIRRLAPKKWEIRARAFRFRNIQYPHLIPRNPKEFLPQWAKQNLGRFAKEEPLLWSFVSRTENLIPEAKPLYQTRSQMFLNDVRMNFFLSKAGPK